jgi:hypothetical protein
MKMLATLIVTALAMLTASVNANGMVIQPVAPQGTMSSTYPFRVGESYKLVVYLKNKEPKVYEGTCVGWAMVRGVRGKAATEGVIFSGKAGTPVSGEPYCVFKGAHSSLLYKNNHNWLIVNK